MIRFIINVNSGRFALLGVSDREEAYLCSVSHAWFLQQSNTHAIQS